MFEGVGFTGVRKFGGWDVAEDGTLSKDGQDSWTVYGVDGTPTGKRVRYKLLIDTSIISESEGA